jgi:hypothetical protein
MGSGTKQAGPLGAGEPVVDPRGPVGLAAGSNAAQALPPAVADYQNTVDRKAYSWLQGKAQLLLCRVAAPAPNFSWTLRKIRQETKDGNQLGFTDSTFESALVSNPKAEAAGYFSGRAALKTTVIRIPKELDVTDAQIKAAEARKDKPEEAKRLRALRACRDHLVAHELAHIDKAWDSLSEMTLGWEKKLGTLAEGTEVTMKLMEAAIDEGAANAPAKIMAAAAKWDSDDLVALRGRFRAEHIFIDSGEDGTFDYVEPKEGG